MRIMVIADEESSWLWDHFEKEKLAGVDLIISCGDLHPHYLSFLTTFTSAPVLYVHGNHDDKYEQVPPEGCTCIEDQIFVYEGIQALVPAAAARGIRHSGDAFSGLSARRRA